MGLLDRFSPLQRQLLMYGGAAVGGLVVITKLSGRAKTPAAPGATGGTAVPSTDVLGTGQLMDFESQVTNQLAALAMLIHQQPKTPTPSPVKPPILVPNPSNNPGPPPPPPPPGQVVQLQATGVPGVYAAPVPGMPGVVVGQMPAGPFVYGGTQAQAQAVLDGGASSHPDPAAWQGHTWETTSWP